MYPHPSGLQVRMTMMMMMMMMIMMMMTMTRIWKQLRKIHPRLRVHLVTEGKHKKELTFQTK